MAFGCVSSVCTKGLLCGPRSAMLQALIDQAVQDAKVIQTKDATLLAKDVKIEALTFELAYYKRIRFSRKNESLAPLQRDMFEGTWNSDLSAIEAEVEQLQDESPCETAARPKRPRAGRQPLPDHLPRIEHRHEPESCRCGQCRKDRVKIGDDCRDAGDRATQERLPETSASNWMSSQPDSLSISTFFRNAPAGLAKPSPRPPFQRR